MKSVMAEGVSSTLVFPVETLLHHQQEWGHLAQEWVWPPRALSGCGHVEHEWVWPPGSIGKHSLLPTGLTERTGWTEPPASGKTFISLFNVLISFGLLVKVFSLACLVIKKTTFLANCKEQKHSYRQTRERHSKAHLVVA